MKKYVDVTLENCENYKFKAEDVTVYLEGIMKHCSQYGTSNGVRHCAILIDKKAKPVNILEDWQSEDWKKRISKSRDITHVEVEGARYFVDWHEKDEWENRWQKTQDLGWAWCFIISKDRDKLEEF